MPEFTEPNIDPAYLQLLTETTDAAMVVYRGVRLLYVNKATERLTGFSRDELLALDPFLEIVVPEDRELVRERSTKRLAGESVPDRYTLRLMHRDQTVRWVLWSAVRIEYEGEVAVLGTCIDTTPYHHTEHALQRQLGFEQLILRISKQFLAIASDRFDDGVRAALRTLGEVAGIDRVSLFEIDYEQGVMRRIFGWIAARAVPPVEMMEPQPIERFEWGLDQLRANKPLHVPDVAALPEEAAGELDELRRLGVVSMVAVPLVHQEELIGCLTCDQVHETRAWPHEALTPLVILGEILAGALTRHQAERALEREKERAQVTLAAIGDGVIRTDENGRIDYLNPVAERLTGWWLDEALGREVGEIYEVTVEATGRRRADVVSRVLDERRTFELPGFSILHGRHGHEFVVRDTASPILDRSGDNVIGVVLAFKDLTQIRGLEREMAYLASHDSVTGLYNRLELEIHLEAALERSRERARRHVLLFLDIRQFRLVNDTFGHTAGDELLRQMARVLEGVVGEEGLLARLGGDEFGILLEDATPARGRKIAGEILDRVRDFNFEWGGQIFDVAIGVGLVPITAASESVVHVLKTADAACYLARESGPNRIHESIPDDSAVAERYDRVQWVHRVRQALAEDRLQLFCQQIRPVAADGTDAPLYEVLVRMVDERGERIAPGDFIPVAEQYQLGPSIDRWVVRRTLKAMASGTVLADKPVSINLSGQSLSDDTFLGFVAERLEASGVTADRVFFEITETAAVSNLSRAITFMRELKKSGCRFILDDFGSGLSSFAYLKDLPVDLLKIDGAFVQSMEQDPIQRAMVASIHQIGAVMGLGTIAEWVENQTTLDMLAELSVDYVQGFFIHRPEPVT
ncbi:MAG: EAL domain-containing protein [Acidobacteriota bacterium]